MSVLVDLITLGEIQVLALDSDPSTGGGYAAIIGSYATINNQGSPIGAMYLKTGAGNTAWDKIATAVSGTNVGLGAILQVPVYDTSATGYHLNPTVLQNGQTIGIAFVAQPSRSVGIVYTVPNPGNAVAAASFVLTEGAQTINGNKTFGNDVTIVGNLDVKGVTTTIESTVTTIADPTITLNKGGLAASGGGSGIEIEENALITAFWELAATRDGWNMLTPTSAFVATIKNDQLAANRTYELPNASGSFVLGPSTPAGVNKQIAYWTSATSIGNETGVGAAAFTWDATNHFLGIQQVTPKSLLHVGNNTTSGTVGAGAIILGVLNATANVGVGALIANGSGGTNTASGTDSIAFGASNVASGTASLASGTGNTASNTNAFASGSSTTASGLQATSLGASTTASGTNSFAGGNGSQATAAASFAFGTSCIADGANSHARGVKAQAGGLAGVFIATDSQNFQTTSAQADHMKLRFANGLKLVAGGGADNNDGVNWQRNMASASTTDATVTTAQTIAIPNNSEVLIQTQVIGRKTGGAGTGTTNDGGTYIRTARFKNNGGTVTMFNLQSDYTSEDVAGFNVTMTASGTNALVQVTGAANDNITWFVISDTYVNS